MNDARVPCFILTGFLGSGKTTLLRRLLHEPGFASTAVIVNEFGEVGLDHDILATSTESTLVLPGGCVCCAVREDIEVALRELFADRDAGRIPEFTRLVIETTGLADPMPLLMTLHANPLAVRRLERPRIITVVDGVLGSRTLAAHSEAQSQVAHADLLLMSKADLPSNSAMLEAQLASMNPWAPIAHSNLLQDDVAPLFDHRPHRDEARLSRFYCEGAVSTDHDGARSLSLVMEAPLDWTAFGVWMTMLLHRHGDRVLRAKGILNVRGLAGPVIFHSAQHLVHPPQHLDEWSSDDRRSRLIFIVRGLEPETLKASLMAFNSAISRIEPKAQEYKLAGAGGSIAGRPVRRATAPRWMKG